MDTAAAALRAAGPHVGVLQRLYVCEDAGEEGGRNGEEGAQLAPLQRVHLDDAGQAEALDDKP